MDYLWHKCLVLLHISFKWIIQQLLSLVLVDFIPIVFVPFLKYLWNKWHYSQGSFFKRFYSLIFRKQGRGVEREGEKRQCVVASWVPPTGDLACNPGVCPDWESNWQTFGSQASAQSTAPHHSGPHRFF